MDNNFENYVQPSYEDAVRAQSAFINRVYSWMSVGLAITGCIAWYFGTQKIDFIIKNGNIITIKTLCWVVFKVCKILLSNSNSAIVIFAVFHYKI